jgi:hypothetical protein
MRYRIATGLFALRTVLKLPATPCFGSAIYRAGPDPVRDVMAFCGPGNTGCWGASNQLLGHGWIQLGDELIDFTAGDWRRQQIEDGVPEGMSPSPAEAKMLDPIEWTATPPDFYWQDARSLTGPWEPRGEPEIGGPGMAHSKLMRKRTPASRRCCVNVSTW